MTAASALRTIRSVITLVRLSPAACDAEERLTMMYSALVVKTVPSLRLILLFLGWKYLRLKQAWLVCILRLIDTRFTVVMYTSAKKRPPVSSSSGEACCELLYPVTLLLYFTIYFSNSYVKH